MNMNDLMNQYSTTGSADMAEVFKMSTPMIIAGLVLTVVMLVMQWRIFTKAGKPGWACLIPIFNLWVMYEIVCGRGTAMFRLLIPFYNIYWAIKTQIKLAHAFGKSTAFGVGLIFLAPIFQAILAFGSAQYQGPQEM